MSFLAACGHSKNTEDLKQVNSEMEERIRVLENEKAGMKLKIEELEKNLEMSELLLQQVRLELQGARAPPIGVTGCLQPRAARLAPLFWPCRRILLQTLIKLHTSRPSPDLWNQNLRDFFFF